MKRIEPIWTRIELNGGGYSAAKVYECEDFYVSAGGISHCSTSSAHGDPVIVLFNFTCGVEIVGSDAEWSEWKRQATDKDKREFAYCVLLRHLGIETLKTLLQNEYERGAKDGRNALREEFGELLEKEY